MRANTLLAVVVGTAATAVSNLYWWNRTRTIRESLAVSAARDEAVVGERTRANRTLEAAAKRADVDPEDLPAAIDALHEELADMEHERDAVKSEAGSLRSRWAERWWQARMAEADGPRAIAITIEGDDADARALAKHAPGYNGGVTIVTTEPNHTFVVTVGDAMADLDATDLAAELTDLAGGGAGGSARRATGGGASAGLAEAASDLADRLSGELD
ncbi:alanyl-tRNA synthetase [Halalkalicoccus sp. NIPERK01]|uniref:alanyl-tRNA synthetase n=1 Tax=Halalkalicoccus sp. NIPERK01 TaxID=3053469 RepID=UPI00256EBEF8|nr:alanyl-tRNA synthetase [Halalkalicoccus sp. NIPERK01]MDL5361204.1 alanyl-tRNA synthetase [Halalkalicoccus sp. NIPERK01]